MNSADFLMNQLKLNHVVLSYDELVPQRYFNDVVMFRCGSSGDSKCRSESIKTWI